MDSVTAVEPVWLVQPAHEHALCDDHWPCAVCHPPEPPEEAGPASPLAALMDSRCSLGSSGTSRSSASPACKASLRHVAQGLHTADPRNTVFGTSSTLMCSRAAAAGSHHLCCGLLCAGHTRLNVVAQAGLEAVDRAERGARPADWRRHYSSERVASRRPRWDSCSTPCIRRDVAIAERHGAAVQQKRRCICTGAFAT